MPKRPSPPEGARLFGDAATDSKPDTAPGTAAHYRANIDGGSRGNPGPAAYGVYRDPGDPKGEIVAAPFRKNISAA